MKPRIVKSRRVTGKLVLPRCEGCGFGHDEPDGLNGLAPFGDDQESVDFEPVVGSISFCLRCQTPYELTSKGWVRMSEANFLAVASESVRVKRNLLRYAAKKAGHWRPASAIER